MEVRRLRELPRNFEDFAAEIGRGIGWVFGPAAEAEYRATAKQRLLSALMHPQVETLACFDGERVAGLLWSAVRDGVGHVGFLHVLEPYAGRGVEDQLVAQGVAGLRKTRVRGVVSECICFGPVDPGPAYRSLGFDYVERQLMTTFLDEAALAADEPAQTFPCDAPGWSQAAEIIVGAYRAHPDRRLHPDVHDVPAAQRFLESVRKGGYGRFCPPYVRLCRHGSATAGVIVGCEAAAGVGFVLQVAVRPEFQGQGVGTRLLRELATEFQAAGLSRAALGVTVSNPARRLYERLSFQRRHPVHSYVWWPESAFAP